MRLENVLVRVVRMRAWKDERGTDAKQGKRRNNKAAHALSRCARSAACCWAVKFFHFDVILWLFFADDADHADATLRLCSCLCDMAMTVDVRCGVGVGDVR